MKLDVHHKHILKLLKRDAGVDGWVKVSDKLYPTLSKGMPKELTEFEDGQNGKRARLTQEGKNVLSALDWL